jgi:GT2 family glycosyltransferase
VKAPGLRGQHDAWRCALAAARGDYVAFLGRRAIVTDAWLEQLIALADADPATGLVAPMSNLAPPPQRAVAEIRGAIDSIAPDALDAFAARWRSARRGQWLRAETLAGPCLLLKRAALAASETRRPLVKADLRPDRLSRRVRRAGFTLAVAHDLYVHEEPARTRRSTSPAATETIAATATATATAAAARTRRCRVSLTMIVRDEEANLPACLASVAGLFDELVVVDTGSTDRTAEVARSFGARVFDFVWVDDFAAARNAALARARGDYAFWLDADDRLEPEHRERLGALLDRLRPDGPGSASKASPTAVGGPDPGDRPLLTSLPGRDHRAVDGRRTGGPLPSGHPHDAHCDPPRTRPGSHFPVGIRPGAGTTPPTAPVATNLAPEASPAPLCRDEIGPHFDGTC